MWIVVGGRVTEPMVKLLTKNLGLKFQGVENVLDLVNTIYKKGLGHFEQVEGVIVLSMGCDSLVDIGWTTQLDRLNVPVIYFNNYEDVTDIEHMAQLKNVKLVEDSGLTMKHIFKEVLLATDTKTTEGVTNYA